MAAAHRLTIAKATFQAGLLRPDPACASVARDEIANFHHSLDQTLARCSPDNVQRSKKWCLQHITSSATRAGVLGKYLAAISKAQAPPEDGQGRLRGEASWQRRRLHVVYLLNDLLHHAKNHEAEQSVHIQLTSALQPHLVDIVSSVASAVSSADDKILQKLQDLLGIWAEEGHYSAEYIGKLREATEQASRAGLSEAPQSESTNANGLSTAAAATSLAQKDLPFVMPASHGDSSTPYYDLPAANMMPHIIPNSTVPINTQLMKPLQFVSGPADSSLATAVRDFLEDAARVFDSSLPVHDDEGIVADMDDMGQVIKKDDQTGEVLNGETYYGWSRDFCERMKKRRRGGPPEQNGRDGRGRTVSHSRSDSRSTSPRKRHRYSESLSRSRSRSRSYSRSGSRPRFGASTRRRSSNNYSRSPPARPRHASPRAAHGPEGRDRTPPQQELRPPPHSFPSIPPGPISSSPFTPGFNAPFGLDSNGIPLPPPRPAGWQGPWPPMPPPPPHGMPNMPPIPLPPNAGFMPPIPFPHGTPGPGMNMHMAMPFGSQNHGGPSPPPPFLQQQMQSSPTPGSHRWPGPQSSQGSGGWGGNGSKRGVGRGR